MQVKWKGHKIDVNENLLDENEAWANLRGILDSRVAINTILATAEDDLRHGRLTKEVAKQHLDNLNEENLNLQCYWEFPEDESFLTYQWELPSCRCPTMDNLERAGTGRWIIREDCIYHGNTP